MAQHEWRFQDGFPGRSMEPVVQVGAADTAVCDFDDGFVPGRRPESDVVDPQITRCVSYECRPRQGQGCGCGQQTTTVIPPSMKMVWPFTKSEPLEASQTAGPARS
jgi:hypothetical protein